MWCSGSERCVILLVIHPRIDTDLLTSHVDRQAQDMTGQDVVKLTVSTGQCQYYDESMKYKYLYVMFITYALYNQKQKKRNLFKIDFLIFIFIKMHHIIYQIKQKWMNFMMVKTVSKNNSK